MKPECVFIVGLPRTGSKMVKNVLSHSQEGISCGLETFFMGHFIRSGVRQRLKKFGDLRNDVNMVRLVEYMFSGKLDGDFWEALREGRLRVDQAALTQQLLKTDRSPKEIYAALLKLSSQESPPGAIAVDKTPSHLYHVPALLEWFPQAKIIHTFRDPRAVLVSELRRRARKRASHTFGQWLNPIYSLIVLLHITITWLYAIRLHNQYEKLYPEHYYLVKFEDLIDSPERNIRQLCDFLGIQFQKQMLQPKMTGSSYKRNIETGFDRKASERWRDHIAPWMNLWFTILGKKFLRQFGYLR